MLVKTKWSSDPLCQINADCNCMHTDLSISITKEGPFRMSVICNSVQCYGNATNCNATIHTDVCISLCSALNFPSVYSL